MKVYEMSKQKVYIVEDVKNSPGFIYAIFADEEDAILFRDAHHIDNANVVERSLLYGQQLDPYVE